MVAKKAIWKQNVPKARSEQAAKISKKSASPSGLLPTIAADPACKRTGPAAKLIYKYEE